MGRPPKEIRTNLTEDERDFAEALRNGLPPVIARHEVDKYLGGLVSPLTIRNADREGKGPDVAWRVGKKIAYKTESLISWLIGCGVVRVQNAKTL